MYATKRAIAEAITPSLSERAIVYLRMCHERFLSHACTSTIMERLDIKSPEGVEAVFEDLNRRGLVKSEYVYIPIDSKTQGKFTLKDKVCKSYKFTLTDSGCAEANAILARMGVDLRARNYGGNSGLELRMGGDTELDKTSELLRNIDYAHIWA
jgi:hypothetical protein